MPYDRPYIRRNIRPYDRVKAVQYAHRWAFARNPAYFNFDDFGGDCTNYASQCLYAGSMVMNYTQVLGWYYISSNNRTPSWTGVNFLYNFLTGNRGAGPFAVAASASDMQPGDIIQLSFQGGGVYQHSPVVVYTGYPPSLGNILIAAHTIDRDYYPVTNYTWKEIRFLHILGVRA